MFGHGDPAGKQEDFAAALEAFITEMDQWNYLPVFYESSEEMVMLLHEFGYDFIKFERKPSWTYRISPCLAKNEGSTGIKQQNQ